jgi:hypothetical protein
MPRYWFRQKTFGYGATPNTWQGWVFLLKELAEAVDYYVPPKAIRRLRG